MTMELSDFETRRADNLIWNGAGDYGIETGLRVFDAEGRAQLYWNTVIGAVHRHYTWDELLELYESFADALSALPEGKGRLLLAGNALRSNELLRRICADRFGRETVLLTLKEEAALGCAYLAGM